jgi:hypothetical protein
VVIKWHRRVFFLFMQGFRNTPNTPRERYTSRQATVYKETLRRLVAEDQRLYPTDLVLEGFDMVAEEKVKGPDGDFFAGKIDKRY